MSRSKRRGMTILELLVVILIVGLLSALSSMNIRRVREHARKSACLNNIKQLAFGALNYESSNGCLPPSMIINGAGTQVEWTNGWSIHARILPYYEVSWLYNSINFSVSFLDRANQTSISTKIHIGICPDEEREYPQVVQQITTKNTSNYAWSMGDWYVWGGLDATEPNRSAFGPNQYRKLAEFTDGLAHTLLMAEVKAEQTYLSQCGMFANVPVTTGGDENQQVKKYITYIPDPSAKPIDLIPEYDGKKCKRQIDGHTSWADGGVAQTGFTTAWAPNKITGPNRSDSLDIISRSERLGGPTYAAVKARSYHDGGVNCVLADGSARFVRTTLSGNLLARDGDR